jgi:hypothetical protein
MNLIKTMLSVTLLLTIALQSQAMFRNLASRLATRMPAASMMGKAKLAMPKLAQRTFATAKPAAKSMWAKPMMARAAMLGGLGSAMAFANLNNTKAEGQEPKLSEQDIDRLNDFCKIDYDGIAESFGPKSKKPQVLHSAPVQKPLEQQQNVQKPTSLKANVEVFVKCREKDEDCKKETAWFCKHHKVIADLIKEGINKDLSPKKLTEQIKLIRPEITDKELELMLKGYIEGYVPSASHVQCHKFNLAVSQDKPENATIGVDAELTVPLTPDQMTKGAFNAYANFVMTQALMNPYLGLSSKIMDDDIAITKINNLSMVEEQTTK